MGLLSFLEALVTGKPFSDRELAQVRGEVSFSDALNAHLEWKRRLVDCIENEGTDVLDVDEIGSDSRCVLGQWIEGDGRHHFGELSSFAELREHHAHFHELAHRIVTLARAHRSDEARQLMSREFQQTSLEIVSRIQHLSRLFGS